MNNKLKAAFTLVELLVVIAIVGILSGLIIVGMNNSVNSANLAKAQIFSSSLRDSLMANLISEWKFDGTGLNDGDTANTNYTLDTWSSNNGTTITGTPKVYSGSNCVFGSCLYFDGSSAVFGSSTTLIPSQAQYTVEGWVKIPTGTTGTPGRRLISLGSWEGGFPSFSPCYWTQYKPLIYLNGSNFRYSSSDLRDNKWHNIAFVVTGSAASDIDNAKIYIDGKIDTAGFTTNTDAPITPSGNFTIGFEYTGHMDTIRIYNAVMPTSLIRAHYYAGLNRLYAKGEITKKDYQERFSLIDL